MDDVMSLRFTKDNPYAKTVYGYSDVVSNIISSGDDLTNEIINKYFKDLTIDVPWHVYEENPCVQYLFYLEGIKLGTIQFFVENLTNQCYINTATEKGLSEMEQNYGIIVPSNSTFESRREVLRAKKRSAKTTTEEMIKNVCESFSGGTVEVITDNPNYKFTIKFVGIMGIPQNMKNLIDIIEEIKPAHLAYDFEYKYLNWNESDNKNKTFSDMDAIIWDDWENGNI